MSIESDIINAVTALGVFSKVRYLVAESDSENDPTSLPIFVLDGAEMDYSTRDFCGVALVIVNYTAVILADTASQCRDLLLQVISAIQSIVTIVSSVDTYDDEDGFYSTTLTLTTL